MNLGNAIKMAFKSLATSKMRTFLTMLGVIIGVLTVALLTTVTDGATAAVIGNLKRESTMSLILVNKETSVKTFDETIASAKQDEKLGAFDYSVVIRNSANVNSASKVVSIMTGKDANGNPAPSEYYKRGVAVTTQIYAVRANYDIVRNLKYEGEWLSEDGEIVVDREFIDVFFGENVQTGDVIGQTVKLGGETLLSIKINTSSEATQSEIYNAIRLTLAGYLSLPINNLSKLYNGTATPDEISEIYADIDAALSTIYQDENDGVYEIRIAPTAFVADSALVSGFKLALMQAGITDENVLDSVVVSDYFDSSFEREYRIVGVAEESSAFSMNSSGDMEETLQSMGTEFAALTEAMARSAQGRVYMLISDDNARVIDQTTGSADNLIIYGAYLRYEDENAVADGNIRIMMAFMRQGYQIMSDILPVSMDSVAALVNTSMNVLTIMLTVISSISLVVGGIGIMNIMLVAVSERTREIGIRKAIGAKRSSILTQFLVEALIVSLLGGAIGLLLSWIGSLIIGAVMGISLAMPLWVIVMSVGFCLVIGVAFGMYPAIKASRLEAIDALRHD